MNRKSPNDKHHPPRNKEKRDYFSDKEQDENGPDKNEGKTRSQNDPTKTGMDYFEEGEGNPEREKEIGRKKPTARKRKAA